MPRIERLKENTPEWHRWRLQGLGASDAPVVMGDAPFRTRRFLWSVKTGLARESAVGPAARRGRTLEYAARIAYERYTGIQMEPLCLVHDGLEWMRASLDGLSFDGAIALEIKCPWGNRDQAALSAGLHSDQKPSSAVERPIMQLLGCGYFKLMLDLRVVVRRNLVA